MALDIPLHLSNKIIKKGKIICEFRFPEEANLQTGQATSYSMGTGGGRFLGVKQTGRETDL